MHVRLSRLTLLLLLFSLVACGGGGGANTVPPVPPIAALTFIPGTLTTTTIEGDAAWLEVDATLSTAPTGDFYVLVNDPAGVFMPNITVTTTSSLGARARMRIRPTLAATTHTGDLHVRLCKDPQCSTELPGSPVALPYRLTVSAGRNLTSLTALPGATDWITFQGDAGHAGHAPIVVDATRFTRRWTWVQPSGQVVAASTFNMAVADKGRVYLSTGSHNNHDYVYALNESDGATRWTSPALTINGGTANPPALTPDGNVVVAVSGSDTALWLLDGATGNQIARTPFVSQWDQYYAPTLAGDVVLNQGGYMGGLNAFEAGTGVLRWTASGVSYTQSTPAADSRYAYLPAGRTCNSCDDAGLVALDLLSGTETFRVAVPGMGFAVSPWNSAPVLRGDSLYMLDNDFFSGAAQRQLIAFDIAGRRVRWKASGTFFGSPVVGDGKVYVSLADPERVQARNALDGSILWTWVVPTTLTLPAGQALPDQNHAWRRPSAALLLTNNVLFYSSNLQVHALDLANRSVVWTHPRPGELSLSSNGVLYIASSQEPWAEAQLSAINLR